MSKELKKYYIPIDKGFVIVNEHQIMKPRWVNYFGGEVELKKFIKKYK
jgi:hypothetical protein